MHNHVQLTVFDRRSNKRIYAAILISTTLLDQTVHIFRSYITRAEHKKVYNFESDICLKQQRQTEKK